MQEPKEKSPYYPPGARNVSFSALKLRKCFESHVTIKRSPARATEHDFCHRGFHDLDGANELFLVCFEKRKKI